MLQFVHKSEDVSMRQNQPFMYQIIGIKGALSVSTFDIFSMHFIFGGWDSHLRPEFANLASVACQLALGINPLSLLLRKCYYR